jgi:hypothetical protein
MDKKSYRDSDRPEHQVLMGYALAYIKAKIPSLLFFEFLFFFSYQGSS